MKKCILLLCSLVVSLGFITSCNHSNPDNVTLKEGVTTDEALAIINENKGNKDFVILDVRTEAEVKEGYLKGHLEVPDEEADVHPHGGVVNHNFYAKDIDQWLSTLDKGKRYLIHCRTDVRSKKTFEKLKALGFEKIQYIIGGYTKWANEQKPIEKPAYEKALDVHIIGDKTKTKGTIKFDFLSTNLDGDPIRKANLSLKIFSPDNTEVEKKEDFKTDNDGKGVYEFTVKEGAPKGLYRLVCEGTHKDANGDVYKPVDAYYYFEVAEEDVPVAGNSDSIKIEDDITTDIAKKFYNRNIYGYKAYNNKGEAVNLEKSVDKLKPTLVILFSPLCGGCMTKAQDLIKYKLGNITVIPVVTSINEDDLTEEIKTNETLLRDTFHLDELVPSALYDAKDKIWGSRFKFKSTPKFVLINKEGQVKDIVHGSESLKIEDLLKKIAQMFNLPDFELK